LRREFREGAQKKTAEPGRRAEVYDLLSPKSKRKKNANPTQTDGQGNQPGEGKWGGEAPKRRTAKSVADQQAKKERIRTGRQR